MNFHWQGSIGQGLKASIQIPDAIDHPAVVMRARGAQELARAAAPHAWVVDLRLVSSERGASSKELLPRNLLPKDRSLTCAIDTAAIPGFELGKVQIGCLVKGKEVWIAASETANLSSKLGIVLKSPPRVEGASLVIEFLDWPAGDPMIGGT